MNEKDIRVHPRHLARSVAKAQLKAARVTGFCRPQDIKGKKFPSIFSSIWRSTAAKAAAVRPKKNKKKGRQTHGNR